MSNAGWYPDPRQPGGEAFWDGSSWTGQQRPAAGGAPAAGPAAEAGASTGGAPATGDSPATEGSTSEDPKTERLPSWQAPPDSPTGAAPPAAATSGGWGAPPPQSQGQYSQGQSPQGQYPQGQYPQNQPPQGQYGQPPAAQQYPQPQQYPPGQQPPPGYPAAAAPGWVAPPPAGPARRASKRTPLIIGAVAVAALAIGGGVYALQSDDAGPSFTYQGKEIASPGDVLDKAQSSVESIVAKRHGVKSKDTRCYYARASKPASGAKKTDVESTLRCGPVLFVDGTPTSAYLPVTVTGSESSSKTTLTPQGSLDGVDPAPVPADLTLVRPDGQKAPEGSGGLKAPDPVAAERDTLTSASLGTTSPPSSLTDAVIVGRDTKVTLQAAGEIPRYGAGDDARSAPSGQKLIAFRLDYGSGDVTGSGSSRAGLAVDGGTPKSIPEAGSGEWIVAAIPKSGAAEIVLDDGGFPQTLALPSGRPGARNIAVLTRQHRTGFVGRSVDVPIRLSQSGRTANVTFHGTAGLSSLDFWVPGHTSFHPSNPRNAFLSVKLNYTDSGNPGKTYGFDPQMLRMKLPDGRTVRARNVAPSGRIFNVFEVPATFTSGNLLFTGQFKVGTVTVRVTTPKSIPVTLQSG